MMIARQIFTGSMALSHKQPLSGHWATSKSKRSTTSWRMIRDLWCWTSIKMVDLTGLVQFRRAILSRLVCTHPKPLKLVRKVIALPRGTFVVTYRRECQTTWILANWPFYVSFAVETVRTFQWFHPARQLKICPKSIFCDWIKQLLIWRDFEFSVLVGFVDKHAYISHKLGYRPRAVGTLTNGWNNEGARGRGKNMTFPTLTAVVPFFALITCQSGIDDVLNTPTNRVAIHLLKTVEWFTGNIDLNVDLSTSSIPPTSTLTRPTMS